MAKRGCEAPLRTCLGTGQVRPQADLLRFGAVEGRLTPDPGRRLPGRGVYCLPTAEAYQKAMLNPRLRRSLRLTQPLPGWAEVLAQLPARFVLPNP